MKLSLAFTLLTMLALGFVLMPAKQAQQQQSKQEVVSSFEIYAKWRKDFLEKLPDGKGAPHYSLAVVAQRLDNNSARLEITMVGRTAGYTIDVRPLYVDGTADDQSGGVPAGSEATTKVFTETESNEINPIREHEIEIVADISANAVEVKWTPEGSKTPGPYTIIMPLKDAPTTSVAGSLP